MPETWVAATASGWLRQETGMIPFAHLQPSAEHGAARPEGGPRLSSQIDSPCIRKLFLAYPLTLPRGFPPMPDPLPPPLLSLRRSPALAAPDGSGVGPHRPGPRPGAGGAGTAARRWGAGAAGCGGPGRLRGPVLDPGAAWGRVSSGTVSRRARRRAPRGVFVCFPHILLKGRRAAVPARLPAAGHRLRAAHRRSLRAVGLPAIVLARRIGMAGALRAPSRLPPDGGLSEIGMHAPLFRRLTRGFGRTRRWERQALRRIPRCLVPA